MLDTLLEMTHIAILTIILLLPVKKVLLDALVYFLLILNMFSFSRSYLSMFFSIRVAKLEPPKKLGPA